MVDSRNLSSRVEETAQKSGSAEQSCYPLDSRNHSSKIGDDGELVSPRVFTSFDLGKIIESSGDRRPSEDGGAHRRI
jgi:hypothetical protein